MTNEKEMQEKYFEMQLIGQQMKQLQQQAMAVEHQIADFDVSVAGIESMEKASAGDDVMFPIVSGIFLRGSLKDSKKCVVNVGAGVAVEKTMKEAATLLETQKQELMKFREDIHRSMHALEKRAMEIEKELQK